MNGRNKFTEICNPFTDLLGAVALGVSFCCSPLKENSCARLSSGSRRVSVGRLFQPFPLAHSLPLLHSPYGIYTLSFSSA